MQKKISPAVEQTEQRETNKTRLNMSYDKLKSLVANVEAIETAMKIRLQGRNATQEEKKPCWQGIRVSAASRKC